MEAIQRNVPKMPIPTPREFIRSSQQRSTALPRDWTQFSSQQWTTTDTGHKESLESAPSAVSEPAQLDGTHTKKPFEASSREPFTSSATSGASNTETGKLFEACLREPLASSGTSDLPSTVTKRTFQIDSTASSVTSEWDQLVAKIQKPIEVRPVVVTRELPTSTTTQITSTSRMISEPRPMPRGPSRGSSGQLNPINDKAAPIPSMARMTSEQQPMSQGAENVFNTGGGSGANFNMYSMVKTTHLTSAITSKQQTVSQGSETVLSTGGRSNDSFNPGHNDEATNFMTTVKLTSEPHPVSRTVDNAVPISLSSRGSINPFHDDMLRRESMQMYKEFLNKPLPKLPKLYVIPSKYALTLLF